MKPEYIRLSAEESIYSQKNVLEGQINSINLIRIISRFRRIRIEELILKIKFKELLERIKMNLFHLDKFLPDSEFLDNFEAPFVPEETKKEISKNTKLEEELDSIKSRLFALSSKIKR